MFTTKQLKRLMALFGDEGVQLYKKFKSRSLNDQERQRFVNMVKRLREEQERETALLVHGN